MILPFSPLAHSILKPVFSARSRESDKILADSNPAGICGPVNPCRIHTDSEQRLRPLSFLSRTGNLLQALRSCNFCVLIFSSENCLQKFSASLSAVFSRHSLTQFSNLSFLIRLQISFANLPSQLSILASQI